MHGTQRRPLHPEHREEFLNLVAGYVQEAMAEQDYLPGIDLGPAAGAGVHRVAISRALVALGILEVRRRRIPLAI